MAHKSLKLPTLALLAGLAACGSIPTKVFDVRAINFDGDQVPCLVEVDRKFKEALDAQRYTDCETKVEFTKERMNLRVYPTRRDSQGNVVPPDPAIQAEYQAEIREVQLADPRVQLFILRSNPTYTGR